MIITVATGSAPQRCVCYIIPEFQRQTLEALRQPLESGRIAIARANAHVTYLHYDPAVIAQLRHRKGLPRQRMDFLILFPNDARVVIEVDGKHHFSRDNSPSLLEYCKMARADRDLRLLGYEVYRFGANELVGPNSEDVVRTFIGRLFTRHRIGYRSKLTARSETDERSP